MSRQSLLLVDTTGIQTYIFGSNRLRENIGASYLVSQATGTWAHDILAQIPDVEELYAGGGNFAALLPYNKESDFIRALSRKALELAPGLQLVIAKRPFDTNSQALSVELDKAFQDLAKLKQERVPSAPLLGLGVTLPCESTGGVASDLATLSDEPGYPASAEILAKLKVATRTGSARSKADTRLHTSLKPSEKIQPYDFPTDLDYMGGDKGDQNYIAVVHADGNGIGNRLSRISENYKGPGDYPQLNKNFKSRLRAFSEALNEASLQALRATLKAMEDSLIVVQDKQGRNEPRIVHPDLPDLAVKFSRDKKHSSRRYVPFRPLVFGGDDVTFLCDGRLGIALAVLYLQEFENATAIPERAEALDGKATACAGVAIVKAHYPFARAYACSEQLCKSAKTYRRELERLGHKIGGCLDWHFTLTGLSGDIEEIRKREYTVKSGKLYLRPVTLDANPEQTKRSWLHIRDGLKTFQGDEWIEKRNKQKALREILRQGSTEVEAFCNRYQIRVQGPLWENGTWSDDHCSVFDALEMADIFIPVGESNTREAKQ